MWRRPVLECLQEKSKAGASFFFGESERTEDLALNILAVNTDGSRAKLCAVQDHVISKRPHSAWLGRRRIRFQFIHIALVRRGKWMMGGGPTLAVLIPLEHREIGHPKKMEITARKCSMLRSIFLSERNPQQACGCVNRLIVLFDLGLHTACGLVFA